MRSLGTDYLRIYYSPWQVRTKRVSFRCGCKLHHLYVSELPRLLSVVVLLQILNHRLFSRIKLCYHAFAIKSTTLLVSISTTLAVQKSTTLLVSISTTLVVSKSTTLLVLISTTLVVSKSTTLVVYYI